MAGARITVDGLWRCLCPSINAAIPTRTVPAPCRPRRGPARKTPSASLLPTNRAIHSTRPRPQSVAEADKESFQSRSQTLGAPDDFVKEDDIPEPSVDNLESAEGDGQHDASLAAVESTSEPGLSAGRREPEDAPPSSNVEGPRRLLPSQAWRTDLLSPKQSGTIIERILETRPPYNFPPEMTTENVVDAIRVTRSTGKPKWRRMTAALVKHLLDNDIIPNTFMYETLFNAHSLPEGSADVVETLLDEMRTNRVPWSQYSYHAAIRALAVHPNYIIRNDLLREMKSRWVEVLDKGHRYIAIGLLRDEQYELALEQLESMLKSGKHVEDWVLDIFIYVFGKLGFLDDALRIARHRADRGSEVPISIWYFLLDLCSKSQNYEATTYIWNRTVRQGIVNPSDGVALNILNMSAAYGDTDLATLVIQYLAARGTRLNRSHYEALADAYCSQGKVDRAIEVYCIMSDAGAGVNHQTVGTLCQALAREPLLIDDALEAMSDLKQKYNVPVGVFNALLHETSRSTAQSRDNAFEKALGLYRRIREFVPGGANLETFLTMLRHCTKPDIAQFFVGEMLAFNVRQDLDVLELMFKINVTHHGPTHRCKDYFFKIAPYLQRNYVPGSWKLNRVLNLSLKLVTRLVHERDPEAWRILDICKENGLGEDRIQALRKDIEAGKIAIAGSASRTETQVEEASLPGWATLDSESTSTSKPTTDV